MHKHNGTLRLLIIIIILLFLGMAAYLAIFYGVPTTVFNKTIQNP